MNNYKYKLQHIDGRDVITHEFPADIGAETLIRHLRDFLCACSWSEEQVKDILNMEGI